jgi:hypothetical protein
MPAVPIGEFGKDHWSTFAYIETCCVDRKGVVELVRMRTDAQRHPGLVGRVFTSDAVQRYPTRLRVDAATGKLRTLDDHDDWDCVEDLEAVGLLAWRGTGIHPVFVLTPLGSQVAGQLRHHKASGGNYCDFTPVV